MVVMAVFAEAGEELWDRLHAPRDGDVLVFRPDEEVLLTEACHLVDDLAAIREALVDRPMLVAGSMGQDRVDPLRGELHRTSQRLESLLRSLRVPDDDYIGDSARELAERRWGIA